MVDAEVEHLCGAGYGEVSEQRVNPHNGLRTLISPWRTWPKTSRRQGTRLRLAE
jgi:hypothetical protein